MLEQIKNWIVNGTEVYVFFHPEFGDDGMEGIIEKIDVYGIVLRYRETKFYVIPFSSIKYIFPSEN